MSPDLIDLRALNAALLGLHVFHYYMCGLKPAHQIKRSLRPQAGNVHQAQFQADFSSRQKVDGFAERHVPSMLGQPDCPPYVIPHLDWILAHEHLPYGTFLFDNAARDILDLLDGLYLRLTLPPQVGNLDQSSRAAPQRAECHSRCDQLEGDAAKTASQHQCRY